MADNEAEIEKLEINALSIIISNIDIARGPSVPDSPMSCKTPSTFIHLNPELFIGGQIDETSIEEMKEFGIQHVFNLREASEAGNTDFKPQLVEAGIASTDCPVEVDTVKWSEDLIDKLLAALDQCKKPALIYCAHGVRAAMLGMAYMATRSRFNEGKLRAEQCLEAFWHQNKEVFDKYKGIKGEDEVKMSEYVKTYIAGKVKNMITRPGMTLLQEGLYVSGQLTEDEIEGLKEHGIRSVVNMRPLTESGQFGAGVLAREEELIKKQSLNYVHVPVPRNGPYDDPEILKVVTAHLDALQRPILVHCRTGGRAKAVLKHANVIP